MTGTALIQISLFIACLAKPTPANTDLSGFIFSQPEVSSFLYGERKIRIWATSIKTTSEQSRWEFRYDPIFSPVVKENGRIDVITEKFMEDDWRTSFFVHLDDEKARELSFTRLQKQFNKTEELVPENVFAIPVSYLTITMPDIIASYPKVTLIGRKTSQENTVGYHFQNPVSCFRIVLSSPSKKIAEDIERLIPMSMIFFNMSTTYSSEPVQVAPILGYVDLHRATHGSTKLSGQHEDRLNILETKFTETNSLWYNLHQNLSETVTRSIEHHSKLSAEQLTSAIGELQKKLQEKIAQLHTQLQRFTGELQKKVQETAVESDKQVQSLSQSIDKNLAKHGELAEQLANVSLIVNKLNGSTEFPTQLQDQLNKLETKFTDTISRWYNQHQNLSETVKRSIENHIKLCAEQLMNVTGKLQKKLQETAAESHMQLQSLSQSINVKHGELAEQLTKVSLIVTKLNECPYPWRKKCFDSGCHCYQSVNKQTDWKTANDYCQSLGINTALASIHNKPENDFVFELMKEAGHTSSGVWIGLTDQAVEGDFKWTDGTPLDYKIWGSGNPRGGQNDYDCVKFVISTTGAYFLDDYCSDNRYSVCKKIPNSS